MDGDASVCRNLEMSVLRSHLRKGTAVGFNYSCPSISVREYLTSMVVTLARTIGFREKIRGVERPVYYYDGERIAIFDGHQEARSSGVAEWTVRDSDGITVPDAAHPEWEIAPPPAHEKLIRENSARLTREFEDVNQRIAQEPADFPRGRRIRLISR